MPNSTAITFVVALVGSSTTQAASDYRGFLENHCFECHDADSNKAGLDLTALPWDTKDSDTFQRWTHVFDKVAKHDMPPPDATGQPNSAARQTFLDSLRHDLHTASLTKQQAGGRVVLRRLNRTEYENTVHDLLGIDIPLQHFLPEDPPSHGFDNVAEGLRLSQLHMAQFLEAADAAIEASLDKKSPPPIKRRLRYHDEESVIDDQKKDGKDQWRSFRVSPDAVTIFDDNSPSAVRQFSFRQRGRYKIRVSAAAVQANDRPVWLKIYATNWKTRNLLGYFDLPPEGQREVEVIADIEQGWLLELKPYDTNYDTGGRALYGNDAYTYQGRGIAIDWIDVEGPFTDPGHRQLELPESQHLPDNLRDFATRAFRRPVTTAEISPYQKLAQTVLDDGRDLADAVRVAYRAILTSPRFLFLEEQPGKLDDHALASRLSYFLGSTCPDETLLALAATGTLHQPEVLHAQVERLLGSPAADTFIENFTGQVARATPDRFHPTRQKALPRVRRPPQGRHARGNQGLHHPPHRRRPAPH